MTKLYEDALKLTINKNLSDIRILLQWAEEATQVHEKMQHTEQAIAYLQDVAEKLRDLQRPPMS